MCLIFLNICFYGLIHVNQRQNPLSAFLNNFLAVFTDIFLEFRALLFQTHYVRFVLAIITCCHTFKSQCRNLTRISNQFRKIEFWFIPPKQPFGMVISENDVKKSPSALNLDNFRSDFKATVRARKISC